MLVTVHIVILHIIDVVDIVLSLQSFRILQWVYRFLALTTLTRIIKKNNIGVQCAINLT